MVTRSTEKDKLFGARIKSKRLGVKKSRREIAEKMNISQQQLEKYETAENRISAGKLIEIADKNQIYEDPLHPYTEGLMSAIPVPNPKIKRTEKIPRGEIPSPINPPSGCRFHPRCPKAFDRCPVEEPLLKEVENDRYVACHLHGN